jgi:hypothetical protein
MLAQGRLVFEPLVAEGTQVHLRCRWYVGPVRAWYRRGWRYIQTD